MLTLALDCSTSRGSVALGRADAILWEKAFPAGRGHGGELFTTLQEGLRAVASPDGHAEDRKLGGIVVGLGPGSYSGVRQAIAVASGLGLATGARLIGVPSTVALDTDEAAYHVIGDARRGTFYYTAVERGQILDGPGLLESSAALLERLALHPEWPVLAVEGVPASLPAGVGAIVALPRAARLLAADVSLNRDGALEPIYLRPPAVTLPKPGAWLVP